MKTTILAVLGALASMATAQDEPYYNVTSKPFHLVVKSATNKTLNDRTLSPCHEGAAIEALCLGGKKLSTASVYNFNILIHHADQQRHRRHRHSDVAASYCR
jgi:hypothetical protein